MNSIEYYRQLCLLEFGYPLDGKVLNLYKFIEEQLKGLRYLSHDTIILEYYRKSDEIPRFTFNQNTRKIIINYDFYNTLCDDYDLSDDDIIEIVHARIIEKFRL